ncbi:MAG: hypothetical protein U5N26_08860 [Candidatus Marinimicrobia bacterium]|nr:hypothetical protein [Candidatus Neomarinimicrobiota bacterium]
MLQLAGYYKERAGDYEGALDAYRKYNALYLDDVEYLKKQANLLDDLGRYEDELEVWEYIIEIEPDDNDAINAIIDVLGKMGRDPERILPEGLGKQSAKRLEGPEVYQRPS